MASPGVTATPSGARVFAAVQRNFVKRADPRYTRMSIEFADRYAKPTFALTPLSKLLKEPIVYGTSERLSEDAGGVSVLRMNNLTMYGWDTSDVKYLDATQEDLTKLALQPDDILINRTNGSIKLVGKAAVFDLEGTWLFASYLLRVRVDQNQVLPDYLVHFLNSPAGRLQIERVARPILMVNVSPPEIGSLVIPLPSIAEQRRLIEPVREALAARMSLEAAAADEIKSINSDFFEAVGINYGARQFSNVYAATPSASKRLGRLGVQFFHPERVAALELAASSQSARPRMLGNIAQFVSATGPLTAGEQLIGLASVESDTGELLPGSDEPGDGKLFQRHDVLFSRLRPYLNKVYCADRDGCCSPEFHVLRASDEYDPVYLAMALRSPLTLAQTRHLSTGNTHPRVVEADASRILIPTPPLKLQKSLGKRLEERRSKAQRIRREANDRWVAAQTLFNEALLGPSKH